MESIKIQAEALHFDKIVDAFTMIEGHGSSVATLVMSSTMFTKFDELIEKNSNNSSYDDSGKKVITNFWGAAIEVDQTLPKNIIIFKPEKETSTTPVKFIIKHHKQKIVKKDLLWKLLKKQDEF